MTHSLELTEAQIQELLRIPKQLSPNFDRIFDMKRRRGHSEGQLDITTPENHSFHIRLRQSSHNPLDFSAIFGYYLISSGKLFRLRRYNEKSHEHTNRLEGERFYDFHIHEATERYQLIGADEDRYAVPTDRYSSLSRAFYCLLDDCSIALPGGQLSLSTS